MLKKLFISLIILSTLATEGIINFPGNIYNFLTCLKTEAGQSKNIEVSEETSKDLNENNGMFSGAFKLTSNSIQRLQASSEIRYLPKTKIAYGIKSIFDNINIYLSYKLRSETTIGIHNNNIFFTTDTSPPMLLGC
jgi:hypothetical protein